MHAIFEGLYKVATCRLSGPLSIPRLQGTAALQANNGCRNLDQDLEGVRSLGAALIDESFVWSGRACVDCCGLYRVPRLQGTAALQANNGYRSLDRNLEGAGPSEPRSSIRRRESPC